MRAPLFKSNTIKRHKYTNSSILVSDLRSENKSSQKFSESNLRGVDKNFDPNSFGAKLEELKLSVHQQKEINNAF